MSWKPTSSFVAVMKVSWMSRKMDIEMFHRTKISAAFVQDLVIATWQQAPSTWTEAARLIVDYTVTVLRTVEFRNFLHSHTKAHADTGRRIMPHMPGQMARRQKEAFLKQGC
ncbi:hypothetical protein BDU57DRAFT_510357 [Ampelomyces quisqualis]|uniref:Uncharacterized protein n=1 Tax=Ampelomyces quisqualis TaxID=50730 RepID=A0A6A5R6I6_AMPQU|nr:hypothetical protein BDU57DRAFT_510357 [Ampelomyces quisqualis]